WLTNKVDRSVTGKVALQQSAGPIQLPLNNLGVVAMDYHGVKGIATSIGHAPVTGLINPGNGSVLSVSEALTNIIWAPLQDGLRGVSLSANWMWPAKNKGEDARLYSAVKAISDFAIDLGINIPTGKDSLSMSQKYPDGNTVYAPGTVIVTAVGEVTDIRKVVKPVLHDDKESHLIYINLTGGNYHLGGSSFAQITGTLASETPEVKDTEYFARTFDTIQHLIADNLILAGHDISAGGMITALLEMTFTRNDIGLEVNLSDIPEKDIFKLLFSENPGIIIQVKDLKRVTNLFDEGKINYHIIGKPISGHLLNLTHHQDKFSFDIASLRDFWFKTSYLFDRKQCGEQLALSRYKNYKEQPLWFSFPKGFTGKASHYNFELSRRTKTGVKAAIIREKGVNGDREMAWSLHLAGFDVKDVHMTDLISGRETLEEIHFIVFVGGFSNSDVLGSAKGWAGAFLFNEKAKTTLDNFYKRNDTLSLGICNG
ncbi:MAG: phosphoribosylformylglycinamidine synthase subunit PurQ, partial [Bacteroidales bacterium]|nr:phosphoribosylformylglycinamidine synthase subunit PurQ [Bacteroidales bacterium]